MTPDPPIPPDAVERATRVLQTLEANFRPLVAVLTFADEPAVTFDPAEDSAE